MKVTSEETKLLKNPEDTSENRGSVLNGSAFGFWGSEALRSDEGAAVSGEE